MELLVLVAVLWTRYHARMRMQGSLGRVVIEWVFEVVVVEGLTPEAVDPLVS